MVLILNMGSEKGKIKMRRYFINFIFNILQYLREKIRRIELYVERKEHIYYCNNLIRNGVVLNFKDKSRIFLIEDLELMQSTNNLWFNNTNIEYYDNELGKYITCSLSFSDGKYYSYGEFYTKKQLYDALKYYKMNFVTHLAIIKL